MQKLIAMLNKNGGKNVKIMRNVALCYDSKVSTNAYHCGNCNCHCGHCGDGNCNCNCGPCVP